MGIVFDTKVARSYKTESICQKPISHQTPLKELTRQNIQFLKNLGLKIKPRRSGESGK